MAPDAHEICSTIDTRSLCTVRQAGPEDIQAVIDLAVEMVVYSVSPLRPTTHEEVRKYRRADLEALETAIGKPHAGVFLAETAEGMMIGHVIVFGGQRDSSTGETQAWVFDLAVRREWWGRGIGQQLMEAAEQFARTQNCERLGLGVTIANERAVRFYQELGYLEERVQMVKKL